MGLWAKGFKRSETDQPRLETLSTLQDELCYDPFGYISSSRHDYFHIHAKKLFNRFKGTSPKSTKVKSDTSQIIIWEYKHDEPQFLITDQDNHCYIWNGYGEISINDIGYNVLTNRRDKNFHKADLYRTVRGKKKVQTHDLTKEQLTELKHLLKSLTHINGVHVNERHKEKFNNWTKS